MYKQRRWETDNGTVELLSDVGAKRALRVAELVHQAYSRWQQQDTKHAESLCQDILKEAVDNAAALHILGAIAHERDQHRDASAYLRRAIQSDPRLMDAHVRLGEVLWALQQYVEATAAFNRALELDPHHIPKRD